MFIHLDKRSFIKYNFAVKKIDLNFTIKDDLEAYLEAEGMNIDTASKHLEMSTNTLLAILNNENVDSLSCEKFYSSIYEDGYHINQAKIDLLHDLKDKILFHGSKYGLKEIKLDGSRLDGDYGPSFYLSDSYDSVAKLIYPYEKSSIYAFKLNLHDLNVYKLDYSLEWILTICYFRKTLKQFSSLDLVKKYISKLENVDLIISPICDNRTYYILDLFIDGYINLDVTLNTLMNSFSGFEYVIKSYKALDNLIPIEKYYLSKKEREDIHLLDVEKTSLINKRLKLAEEQFKNGSFIEDIL